LVHVFLHTPPSVIYFEFITVTSDFNHPTQHDASADHDKKKKKKKTTSEKSDFCLNDLKARV
jgi:hypothetical protein